jgi:TRAP-type transport system large permease protein
MIWVAVALATLLSIGAPVFVAMGLSGAVGLWAESQMQILIATKLFTGMDSFVLLAGPFFILAGEIMSRCGLTERLIRLSFLVTKRIRGGTAYSAVGAAVILSGVSGTAVGDAAALGSIFVREMPKEGYTKDYSAGLIIACSMLGPIIPPSVIMVIYAAITQVNIIDLFVAGIVPGLLIAAALAITIFIGGVRGDLPRPENRIQPGETSRLIWEGLLVLSLPVVIIRGAVAGVFTATEAGGLAAVYAAFLGFAVFRSLTAKSLVDALVATAKISAALYLILGASEILSYVVIVTGLDEYINALASLFADRPSLFLFAVALFFLVIGTFLEPGPAVLLFIPLLLPTVSELGVDPLQFALVVLLTLTLGLITPPVGVCMFVVGRIANLGTGRLTKAVLPFFVAELAVVALLCAFPVLSSGLPKLLR